MVLSVTITSSPHSAREIRSRVRSWPLCFKKYVKSSNSFLRKAIGSPLTVTSLLLRSILSSSQVNTWSGAVDRVDRRSKASSRAASSAGVVGFCHVIVGPPLKTLDLIALFV